MAVCHNFLSSPGGESRLQGKDDLVTFNWVFADWVIYRFLFQSANRQISKSENLILEDLEKEYLPLRDKVRELREYL